MLCPRTQSHKESIHDDSNNSIIIKGYNEWENWRLCLAAFLKQELCVCYIMCTLDLVI